MAIDFMVMPISRYISGDFVTPAMRSSWEQGIPYFVLGPDGKRDLPPGLPFGGAGATEYRGRIVDMVLDDLRELPSQIARALWDERSAEEPRIQRVDADSYQALLEFFAGRNSRSLFGLRKTDKTAHCTSQVILPCDFQDPIPLTSPFERIAGSTTQALKELASCKFPDTARAAAGTLRDALEDSAELRLPLIVDC